MLMSPELILVIILAVVFDFLNGVHDSSNIVATMIASRAFTPRAALALTATAEFLGPFLFGVTVATTMGDEVAQANVLNLDVIVACLFGAIVWNLLTWFFGIPSSSSHALIGGMIGAVLAAAGAQAVKWHSLVAKVILPAVLAPVIAVLVAGTGTWLLYRISRGLTSGGRNHGFRIGQI